MHTTMDTSSSSSSPDTHPFWLSLPKSYKFRLILGEGAFGRVIKCVRRTTEEVVAVKIPKNYHDLRREAFMMKVLMHHKLDKFNVIKFYDEFFMNSRMCLVFEILDISLQDYLLDLKGPLSLEDTRTISQQIATAFVALKRVGVIHTDVKLDNIMMVDHVRQPFRVKLIDFGLAIFTSKAKPGRVRQTPYYRAPEIILDLPFSEAIDIWSLGCVMAVMIFGFILFPARVSYDTLRFMIDLLGPPPERLLIAGPKSKVFFKKTESNQWILKTAEEYWGSDNYSTDYRFYTFRSLDEMKIMGVGEDNVTEADEQRECIGLLKAMFKWDERERITPSGILNHPFITKRYLNSSAHPSSCNVPETGTQTRTDGNMRVTQVEDSTCETQPLGVIMVRPAALNNRIYLEETSDEDSVMSPDPSAAPAPAPDTRIHRDNINLSTTTSDDSENEKREKRNCFFSCMKRKFCSCCYVDNVE